MLYIVVTLGADLNGLCFVARRFFFLYLFAWSVFLFVVGFALLSWCTEGDSVWWVYFVWRGDIRAFGGSFFTCLCVACVSVAGVAFCS